MNREDVIRLLLPLLPEWEQIEVLIEMNKCNEIKQLRKRLDELEKDCCEWPQDGDRYWSVDSIAIVHNCPWYGAHADTGRASIGNVHRTKEDAETYKLGMSELQTDYPEEGDKVFLRDRDDCWFNVTFGRYNLIADKMYYRHGLIKKEKP